VCRLLCRYLIEKGGRLDAVNNDGELPIDLADGNDMENLLSEAMETQGAISVYASAYYSSSLVGVYVKLQREKSILYVLLGRIARITDAAYCYRREQ